ncbi:MAG TPA: hypothetical protein VEB22_15270 [Phycisphaerales bacterium]|nr:hypothetical protein [Phycisphaerales bacterium]
MSRRARPLPRVAWVPMRMKSWDDVTINGMPDLVQGPGIGFLPVFASQEAAQAAFPGVLLVPITIGAQPSPLAAKPPVGES